ncbi:MAG: hypothetical protein KAU01_10145, partial [Candidatus Cloacimonetes bacterium]|nr:hypothetical protein [Candidatus Cloacimonadota bacterium]
MKLKKNAFGVISRNVDQLSPIVDFFDNAKKYGHKIDHLIICYIDYVNPETLKQLEKYCEVTLVKRGNAPLLENSLKDLGLNEKEIETIIGTPFLKKYGKVSYGTCRNYVILAAIFLGLDHLFFFDTDIFPTILTQFHDGESKFEDIDFVGSHLTFLKKDGAVVTTSDYTGYYIIPKMNFPYMMELLQGIQKEDRFYYISSVDTPVTRDRWLENIFNTNKVLGGNIVLDLNKLDMLPPFFSTTLVMNDECFLGRGEDTLFGPLIYYYGGHCVDIDLLIFHNCFGDFPNKPTITIQKNLDRFYYACMGWIIRNPFFNWLRSEYYEEVETINTEKRLHALTKGSKAAAEYFSDKRFLNLPEAFEMAYSKLPKDIEHFYNLLDAWNKMKKLIKNKKE